MISALLAVAAVTAAPAGDNSGAAFEAVAMGCFLHSSGASPIEATRAAEIKAAGLDYVPTPPADIATRVHDLAPPIWGTPVFARVARQGEDYWVIGFSGGNCLIDATGDVPEKLRADILSQFDTPGVPWKRLPAADVPDRFAVAVKPPGGTTRTIVANLVGMTLPDGHGKEIVTFELAANSGTR